MFYTFVTYVWFLCSTGNNDCTAVIWNNNHKIKMHPCTIITLMALKYQSAVFKVIKNKC